MTARRILTQTFIAGALALQVVAGFKLLAPPERFERLRPLRVAPSPALWPFLDYDMYSKVYEAGSSVDRYSLHAVDAEGGTRRITEVELGVSHREFRDALLGPIREGDARVAARAADLIERRGGARPRALRVERHRPTLEAARVREDTPQLVRTVEIGSAP
jgi:hypothetical protein